MKKKTSAHFFAVPFFGKLGLTLILTALSFSTLFESRGQRDRAISLDFLYERKQQKLQAHLFGLPAAYFKNAIKKTKIGFLRTFTLMSVEPGFGRFSVNVTGGRNVRGLTAVRESATACHLKYLLTYAVIE